MSNDANAWMNDNCVGASGRCNDNCPPVTMQLRFLRFCLAVQQLLQLIAVSEAFTLPPQHIHIASRQLPRSPCLKFDVISLRAKKYEDASDALSDSTVASGKQGTSADSVATSINVNADKGDKGDLQEGLRVKLKEEISSPFRKVRQFIYSGMGIAGALGTVTAVPQLIFAVQDGGDAVFGAVANVLVDVGALALAVVLWNKESSDENIKLDRYTRKEKLLSYQMTATDKEDRERELSLLPVQIQISEKDENATRIVSLGELQSKGKQNIIIVAGKRDFVRDAVISAKIEGADLFNSKEIYVVPVVLEDDQLEAALAKGFGAPKESLMSAPYIGKPMQVNVWEAYLKKETDLAVLQGEVDIVKKGIVVALKKNGKVLRRGVGIPPWKIIAEDLQDKIKADAK